MRIKEIQDFAQVRAKARAYLCYIMGRNISQSSHPSLEALFENLHKLHEAIPYAEVVYALDANGRQITDNISANPKLNGIGKGEDRSSRAYYYKTIREHRCHLTDPYPSLLSNELVVTASFPLYDTEDKLIAIICVDISLKNILRIIAPSSTDSLFASVSRWIYAAFTVALFGVAMLLFLKGVMNFGIHLSEIDIHTVFKSTILLTLSLAIVDLVKAIFEEEVLGRVKHKDSFEDTHQTMVKFLGSIIISLSIEALMLVFKFALIDPVKLIYAVYLLLGITGLIFGLSIYLKVNQKRK